VRAKWLSSLQSHRSISKLGFFIDAQEVRYEVMQQLPVYKPPLLLEKVYVRSPNRRWRKI